VEVDRDQAQDLLVAVEVVVALEEAETRATNPSKNKVKISMPW
jgi:hypothetical protein